MRYQTAILSIFLSISALRSPLCFSDISTIVNGNNSWLYMADTGTYTDHDKLQDTFRSHLSYDVFCDEEDVNEDHLSYRGHGTHVHGIAKSQCLDCNIGMIKSWGDRSCGYYIEMPKALLTAVGFGASVVSYSAGHQGEVDCSNTNNSSDRYTCLAVEIAQARDTVMVAASGNNDGTSFMIDFPARHPDVVAVGGTFEDGNFFLGCQHFDPPWVECNSSYGDAQEFVAQAANVRSTMFPGFDWNIFINYPCGDSTIPGEAGYGLCTGTSMSSPYVAGHFARLKGLLPTTSNDDLRLMMRDYRDEIYRDQQMGFGPVDVDSVIEKVLSYDFAPTAPVFELYSDQTGSHYYSAMPPQAMAMIDSVQAYYPTGPFLDRNYQEFNLYKSAQFDQLGSEIEPVEARMSFYLYTAGGPLKKPLYRLSRGDQFFYTTLQEEIETLKQDGFKLDGSLGYVLIEQRAGINLLTYNRHFYRDLITLNSSQMLLYRAQNIDGSDMMIFPEDQFERVKALGYDQNPIVIGAIPSTKYTAGQTISGTPTIRPSVDGPSGLHIRPELFPYRLFALKDRYLTPLIKLSNTQRFYYTTKAEKIFEMVTQKGYKVQGFAGGVISEEQEKRIHNDSYLTEFAQEIQNHSLIELYRGHNPHLDAYLNFTAYDEADAYMKGFDYDVTLLGFIPIAEIDTIPLVDIPPLNEEYNPPSLDFLPEGDPGLNYNIGTVRPTIAIIHPPLDRDADEFAISSSDESFQQEEEQREFQQRSIELVKATEYTQLDSSMIDRLQKDQESRLPHTNDKRITIPGLPPLVEEERVQEMPPQAKMPLRTEIFVLIKGRSTYITDDPEDAAQKIKEGYRRN